MISGVDEIEQRRKALRKRACRCPGGPEGCLGDDETVTQWAPGLGEFRREPDIAREIDFSVQRGNLTAEECWALMTSSGPVRTMPSGALVRNARVGDLRNAGVAVIHTPAKISNGKHLSVVWPAERPLESGIAPWPPEVTGAVNSCFNEPTPERGE